MKINKEELKDLLAEDLELAKKRVTRYKRDLEASKTKARAVSVKQDKDYWEGRIVAFENLFRNIDEFDDLEQELKDKKEMYSSLKDNDLKCREEYNLGKWSGFDCVLCKLFSEVEYMVLYR